MRSLSFGSLALLALAHPLPAQSTQFPDVHFVPTPMEVVEAMLQVTRVGPKDVVYDLGSGDGRIVITAASRHGARGIGIDIDPQRIKESRQNADSAGVTDKVTFRQADLFKSDLRQASVVTLYLLPLLNQRLRPKLFQELRPGSRIASNAFDMGDWKPDSTIEVPGKVGGTYNVYYWVIPADVSGDWTIAVKGSEKRNVSLRQRYQQLEGAGVEDGRVKGDSVFFTLGDRRFAGRVTGGSASGTATVIGGGEAREWTGTRRARGPGPVPPDTTES